MAAPLRSIRLPRPAAARRPRAHAETAADDELLRRVARGDVRALESIYDRHIAAAWRVALVSTADERSASDAVRGAFRSLWRRPDAAGQRGLVPWLLAAVAHEAGRTAPEVRGA